MVHGEIRLASALESEEYNEAWKAGISPRDVVSGAWQVGAMALEP